MNPKMNMKLELNMASLKALVPVLQKAQPYLFALVIVGAFGYTAYIINAALNVEAAESQTSIKALPRRVWRWSGVWRFAPARLGARSFRL
jgi:hypothetical protein